MNIIDYDNIGVQLTTFILITTFLERLGAQRLIIEINSYSNEWENKQQKVFFLSVSLFFPVLLSVRWQLGRRRK